VPVLREHLAVGATSPAATSPVQGPARVLVQSPIYMHAENRGRFFHTSSFDASEIP